MKLVKLNKEDAIKMISEGADIYLVLSHDLEKQENIGKEFVNQDKGKELIDKSKTIVLNQDEEEDDSFSTLSLYSEKQRNIFNIIPKGIKHDVLLLPMFG